MPTTTRPTASVSCHHHSRQRTAVHNSTLADRAMAAARTTHATPIVVSNTARHAEVSKMTSSDRPAVYPTSRGKATTPAIAPTAAALPMNQRCRRPNGTIASAHANKPPNTIAIDEVTSERLMVSPTLALLPVWLLPRIWSSRPAASVDVGPTWNVYAACTGCESLDTTRQSTTYDPLSNLGRSIATARASPLG